MNGEKLNATVKISDDGHKTVKLTDTSGRTTVLPLDASNRITHRNVLGDKQTRLTSQADASNAHLLKDIDIKLTAIAGDIDMGMPLDESWQLWDLINAIRDANGEKKWNRSN